jgi:micrococcal nuclease
MSFAFTFVAIISFIFGIIFQKNQPPSPFSPASPQEQATTSSQPSSLPRTSTVSHVIDGDTIVLDSGQTVRYTGVAAPEKDEPYYKEAADLNQKLTLGKSIRLEYEKGYEQDKFGRLLAYVFISNSPNNPNLPKETLVNLELVRSGLAKVSIYEKRRKLIYQDQLLEAQAQAQEKKLGVWQ